MVKQLDHYVRISLSSRADLEWWFHFASSWNGISIMTVVNKELPGEVLVSYASGSLGCRAYCGQNWFQIKWAGPMATYHITVKELAPIVVASAIWVPSWKGLTGKVLCDNEAVVAIVNKGTSWDGEVMHLMRYLAYFATRFQFYLTAAHIQVVNNTLVDTLSSNNSQYSTIPDTVLDLMFLSKPDWNSQHWIRLWASISNMCWQNQPKDLIIQLSGDTYISFCVEQNFVALPVSEL